MSLAAWFFASLCALLLPAGATAIAQAVPAATTQATTVATTSPASEVRETVILDDLLDMYEPVPFEHRRHAQMAEMWGGCTTCHHHSPTLAPTTAQVVAASEHAPSQADAAIIPACKSCHPAEVQTAGDIHMPSLKGAYHRQCLSCHRNWMDSNACIICHAVRPSLGGAAPTTRHVPTPDDITGRMHKPIPAPTTRLYVARFTPVAGSKVLFRHENHVKTFGITCAVCHHQDSCASCHASSSVAATQAGIDVTQTAIGSHPLKRSRTWQDTHSPCVSCHLGDRCNHCHYQDNESPPAPFSHPKTGQILDKNHAQIACARCHQMYKSSSVTCGGSECHKKAVSFPADRPGSFIPAATQPAASEGPSTTPAFATTQPGKPVIIKIRRGGS